MPLLGSHFGSNLRRIRKASGETQKELANAINSTAQSISNYEKGLRSPDLETIRAIARHYALTTDDLLSNYFDPIDNSELQISFSEIRDLLKVAFLLFDTDADKGSEFRKAYTTAQSLLKRALSGELLNGQFYYAEWEMAVDGFSNCLEGDYCMEAAANLVTLILLLLVLMPDRLGKAMVEQQQRDARALRFDLQKTIRCALDASAGETDTGRADLAYEYDEPLFELLRKLKRSPDWADFAEFQAANIYYFNLYGSDDDRVFNHRVGLEMHQTQMKLLNEYSLRLMKQYLQLYGILH